MERSDLFISATCTLGFISLFKFLIHSLRWIWVMLLRPPKNLKHYGSWAIVTGSTDGIGKAIAFELASKGLNLLLVGRSPQKLEAMMKEIRERHNNNNDDVEVKVVVMDLGSLNGEEIMRRMEEGMEGLDVGVLVNSAGMAGPYFRYFDEDDMEFVDGIIKVNLEGGTWITKAVLPWMMKKKKGVIVNIGSASSGVVPSYPLSSLYASTKAYLAMFSSCIGLEYKAHGIDVQCQVPLFVSTKMTKMKVSLFTPSAEDYGKASIRWFGYRERVCVPYLFHSLQCLFIQMLPHSLLNWYLLRHFQYLRKRALSKYSKSKPSPSIMQSHGSKSSRARE